MREAGPGTVWALNLTQGGLASRALLRGQKSTEGAVSDCGGVFMAVSQTMRRLLYLGCPPKASLPWHPGIGVPLEIALLCWGCFLWRACFSAAFFLTPFFLAPFCFSAGQKERSAAYVEGKQDPKP